MPVVPIPGPVMTAHSEDRARSAASAIAAGALAVGHPGPTASAVGEACAPAASAAAGSAAAASEAAASAASTAVFDVRRADFGMIHMSYSTSNQILLSVLLITLASCSKPVKSSAQKTVPTTFATPSEAGAALLAAAQPGDRSALLAIFGPDGQEVLF